MGRVIGGRYELQRKLGEGGFGTVFLASDLREPGRQWAVKALRNLADPKQATILRELLDREQKMLSWLSHPAIVQRKEALVEGSELFLVMEQVDGQDLRQLLAGRPRGLSTAAVLELASQVCDTLIYLHSQKPNPIVFRDLKPSNLMLTTEGKVKLIDFGIARLSRFVENGLAALVSTPEPTVTGDGETTPLTQLLANPTLDLCERQHDTHCLGTPGYAAPEQYAASGVASDPRADLYALGAIIFHLLTREPMAGLKVPLPPLRSLIVVDASVEALVTRATAVDREQRFPSARVMARAIADCQGRVPHTDHAEELARLLGPARLPEVKLGAVASGGLRKPPAAPIAPPVRRGLLLASLRVLRSVSKFIAPASLVAFGLGTISRHFLPDGAFLWVVAWFWIWGLSALALHKLSPVRR